MAGEPTRWVVERDDPTRDDIQHLVRTHRDWSLQQTPQEFSFSVEPHGIADAGITLYSARSDSGALLGVGGLRQLSDDHVEIKTMHTAERARGRGVGRAVLQALLDDARRRGCTRASLETGTGESFRPARHLYESFGFHVGEAFGEYASSEHNLFMTLDLSDTARGSGV